MIQFECKACGHRLWVKETAAGRAVICPHCKSRQIVPGGGAGDVPMEPERVTGVLDDPCESIDENSRGGETNHGEDVNPESCAN